MNVAMKTSFALFVSLLISTFACSQNAALRGTVTDKQSSFPLEGVTIVITDLATPLGAVTDKTGHFRIEGLTAGRHSVSVSFLGYEPLTFSNLLFNNGKDLELNIQLQEMVSEMGTVEIIAEENKGEQINKMSSVSTRSFSIEEAMRYSGTLQDPSRMAQNYAGVSGASDDRNDIIIRGNSPTGVLWRMEGIDIPSPNHFATLGTTGGPISMLNINNLANSDFATSAFAAEYGNALSGVFDLRLRTGNRDKREYTGQIGFNGVEIGLEGPFKKGGQATYMANYRYSFLNVMQSLGINFGTGSAIPEYQDLTFKVDLPTQKIGRFQVFGMMGASFIDFDAQASGEDNLYSEENQSSQFTNTTGVVGASHTYFFNEKTYGKLVLAASQATNYGWIDTLDVNDVASRNYGLHNEQYKYNVHYFINSKLNQRHTLKVGIMSDRFDFDVRDSSYVAAGYFFRNIDSKSTVDLIRSYAQWMWRPSEQLTVNAGLHANYLTLDAQSSIEPRFGMRYNFRPTHAFTAGAGLHSQMQPVTIYFNREDNALASTTGEATNTDLGFNKAIHAVMGYEWTVNKNMRIKSEVYYQYLYNIAVDPFSSSFSVLNVGADFLLPNNPNLVNEGTGTNYGAEVTVERFLTKGFYYLFTASLFESKYKGSDGIERNTAFNGNYVFNFLAGKEWKVGESNLFSLDFKTTYAGGRRYSPINLEASRLADVEIRDESQAFSQQYDPYFRIDVKVGFRQNFKKFSQAFFFDVRNVTNHQNIFTYGYSPSTNDIRTTYQTGLFPIMLYTIYF